MSAQPEALRLADFLEVLADEGPNWQVLELSADELRRLHALNQELLEACKSVVAAEEAYIRWEKEEGLPATDGDDESVTACRAAIAKATGEAQ